MSERKKIIGVLGGSACQADDYENAFQVGRLIALNDFILICGGLSGVMEAAAKGAKSENGITIGVLPSDHPDDANPFIDIPIITGMGIGRNIIIVRTSDILVAVNGKYGTLSEIAFACQLGKKVIGLSTWDIPDIIPVNSPEEVMQKIKNCFQN